jgi:hypothetical protein
MPGYARIRTERARGLVLESCHSAVEQILSIETLYDYAARQADARKYKGRAVAYGISLGGNCGNVVVRHAMRGGLLGKSGSDLFFPPTRGLRELLNSIRLKVAGVPTPEVVGFLSYPAAGILRRGDVATREIPESHDLSVVLREMPSGPDRESCLRATATLLSALSKAGAHHPDLNARNVLITWDAHSGAKAHILDVDRIRFHVPSDPMVERANIERLERSLQKLKDRESLPVTSSDISILKQS